MRLKGKEIERYLAEPSQNIPLALIYGPDQGLVRERAQQLASQITKNEQDPFRLCDLLEEECRSDPARLRDEYSAISMWGGTRIISLRINSDRISGQISDLLKGQKEGSVIGDALIVIEAGDLKPSSSIRKCIEAAPNAVAIPCYRDDKRALVEIINSTLRSAKLTADRQIIEILADSLGGDRRITRGELNKLVLYKQSQKENNNQVTEEDVIAVVSNAAAIGLADIAYAGATGRYRDMVRSLDRCFLENVQPVSILRALTRHLEQIYSCLAHIEGGASAKAAADTVKPRIHFSRRTEFERQLRGWSANRTAGALTRLYKAELKCKTTGLPPELICREAALTLTRIAAAGHSRRA